MAAPTVCFDLTPFSSGSRFRGIGMYAFELAQALWKVSANAPGEIDLRFLVGCYATTRVSAEPPAAFTSLHEGALHTHSQYKISKRTYGRIALRKVDLFHAAEPDAAPLFGICRLIVTCHDLIPTVLGGPYLGRTPRWWSRLRDAIRYRAPLHVIAISEATRRDVCDLLGVPAERVTVVHHGVDHDFYHATRAQDEERSVAAVIATDRPYFLYVGAFDYRKQVPTLIRAFGSIAREVDDDLVISGKLTSPRLMHTLLEEAKRSGVSKRIRLVGFVPRPLLPALYRSATAHVLPSLYEGFGMTLVEAMACGCPIIACPVSAMPEVCGDAVEWAKPGDVQSLAQSLVAVSRDPKRRARLGQAGIERAARFTWERAARQTLDVYKTVLTKR